MVPAPLNGVALPGPQLQTGLLAAARWSSGTPLEPTQGLLWHLSALSSGRWSLFPDKVLADPGLSFISHVSQGDNDSPFGKPDARAAWGPEGWLAPDSSTEPP